jgi:hypothetical protein
MIIAPAVKTLLEQNTTIKTNIGCTIEYNMNSMVDNITVTGSDYSPPDGSKPYKKLFPASSVIKPFRPIGAGVKYGVFGDVDLNTWKDPKNIDYPLSYRTYYTGSDTYYKYWLSARGSGASITITYPQAILTNKIVVRFEISHSIPSTWTISKEGGAVLATGTSANIKPFTTSGTKNYDAGTLTIYYNGTTWTTTEPSTLSTPVSISSLSLSTSGASGLHVGVIELSPRWAADISSHIVDFSLAQESSTSPDDILPVGKVSANSMSAALVSYESPRKILSYEKGTAFNSAYLYMYKNAELNPYIKVYYSGAPLSDSQGNYEKIKQGTFYINNWTTSEFGEINLDALDGAKILQDIISPGLVCKDTSAIGIIRKLLDNVGFTNYNINYKTDLTGKITDNSILSPIYWWTDDSKNVWSCIQEICRDSQMVATFDEKNILQFYTRDYLFSQTDPHWNLKYSKDGSILPNIISLQKRDLPAANQVKVLWNPTTASEFLGSAQPLWKSGSAYLGAYSLNTPLSSTSSAGEWISLSPITVNQQTSQILYSYSGYLVIDSEIIEYDAIEYQYINKLGTITKLPIEKNSDLQKFANDVSLLIPANKAYGQTGRVRIKSRGAFGTTPALHTAAGSGATSGWTGYNNIFKTNASTDTTTTSSVQSNVAWSIATPPTLESTPVETSTPSVKKIQKSLFQITCDSTNKKLHSMAVKNLGVDATGQYYTFGTGMFFKSTVKDVDAAGGIGFFTSANGMNGYYVSMETTSNLADSGSDRALGIFKLINGVKIPLTDSQNEKQKTLNYIAGSISYKVDIRVNYDSAAGAVLIDVFINNFKISALDTTDIISPTSNIAIYSSTGSAFFDYVYAVPLNEEQYKNGIMQDQYYGRFGSTTLNFLYGEKLTSNFEKATLSGGKVDEFGTVARELRKISIKYDSRPGFPIFPSTGLSQYVEVLGSRLTSFGAEVYVLNNAGTFVPLDDSQFASFSIIGNTVVQSGQNEYLDKTINEFTNPEQVTFESTWIQTEADAKAISDWIKNQWSKKQSVCELEIFSNPLISVGDLVTINYPSNGLDGTQKFIVSNVDTSFDGGINTKITTRSIYS